MRSVTNAPRLEPGDWRQAQELMRDLHEAVNQLSSGVLHNSKRVSASYTSAEHETYIGVTPSGAMTITLPAASRMKDRMVTVARENNTTHTVTIQAASGNINGAASVTLTTAYQVRRLMSDGANYFTG